MTKLSPLQQLRLNYNPPLPKALQNLSKLSFKTKPVKAQLPPELTNSFHFTRGLPVLTLTSNSKENKITPKKIGIVLSGGQASGGHNVIAGVFDAIQSLHPESLLYGFLGGPKGIIENSHIAITKELLASYRNQGGFDMIGSGRTKIESEEQLASALKTVQTLKLDGLIIVGGDDSNTNAAVLAEYFLKNKCKTCVVGVPKTIDGDLKNEQIEISFGFDTACKTYAETIGNILRDALSAKKYYFFIKIMGRSASHIALECAHQTHPNITLIGEEINQQKKTLSNIVHEICEVICLRSSQGKDYGVILIPEGIIEFIPEFSQMIKELNTLLGDNHQHNVNNIQDKLSKDSAMCFYAIPQNIQSQLLLDRDPHGNVQVSKIETERLFLDMVTQELNRRKKEGKYLGSFSTQPLFLGYEGRSGLPSNFDCQYCYSLGHVAALLIVHGATGYMSCIQNLMAPVSEWQALGIPLTSMMTIEQRHGKLKPVIKKALVDLDAKPFKLFKQQRDTWAMNDEYLCPGPIQFFGPEEITENKTLTLSYES